MRQAGFDVAPDDILTFPTLHMAIDNTFESGFIRDSKAGLKFNHEYFDLDQRLSRVLPGKGHYITALGTKP